MNTGYLITARQGWTGKEFVLNSVYHDDLFKLNTAQITKDVTAYDSFQFTISPMHPHYADFHLFTTFVKVTRPDNGKTLFEGRVITPNDSMDSSGVVQKQITCEGLEGFLHDSIQPFREFHNTTIHDFLQALIDEHNKQVEDYKKIKLGNVTVTNSTDNVYRFTEDDKDTYTNIQDKLISRLGGEIRIRHETDSLYLDYMPKIGQQAQQPIVLAKNLISLQRNVDLTQIITILKPLGATQEPKNGGDDTKKDVAYPRLTISDVNNGSLYLRDDKLIKQFGKQYKTQTWDDVNDKNILLNKGKDYLAKQKNIKDQIQVGYIDLSHISPQQFTEFNCGDTVNIRSVIQGINLNERITGMSLDLINIASSTMTIGDDSMTGSTYEVMQEKEHQAETQKLNQHNDRFLRERINQLQDQVDKLISDKTKPDLHVGKIIDVSEYQAVIDFNQVVKNDVSLTIIRVQYGSDYVDKTYINNLNNVISAGGRYAVYAYFKATSVDDAKTEATNFYNRTQKVVANKQQPIFYAIDVETIEMENMRFGVEAYMDQLNKLGIPDSKIVLYIANELYDRFNLNVERAGSIWLPSYGTNDGTVTGSTKPGHPYDLWQYTSKGKVPGISTDVDMDTGISERFKNQYLR